MLKVPAFGWPPRFLNEAAQAFALIDWNAYVIAQTPNIESVVKAGTGLYDITLKTPVPLDPNYGVPAALFFLRQFQLPNPIGWTWSSVSQFQVQTYDTTYQYEDNPFYFYLTIIPAALFTSPPPP